MTYGETSSMGNVVIVKTDIIAPNGNNLIYRNLHLSDYESLPDRISAGTIIGKTGNSGGVAAHFHFDVNAHNINKTTVTGNVKSTMGQNPAAFFPNVNWQNKNPYSASYSGYRD